MKSDVVLRYAPYVVIALVAVIDLLDGPPLGFVPLLTLGPTFACAYGSVHRTLLAGATAMVVCLVSAAYFDRLDTWQNNVILATIAAVTGAGMLVAHLRLRRERELANVRLVAETVQRVLLRPIPRKVKDLTVALSYTSASAEARIGGDLLEVFSTPYGVRVLLGDVQGKGLAAVDTAAWVLGAFREAVFDERDLVAVSARLETTLARQLDPEEFVTAILAEVDATGIQLLNHGHPPPLLLGADGQVESIEPPEEGLALGLAALACAPPKPQRVPFLPGDRILFYTDGVIESRNAAGTFYPLTERATLLLAGEPQPALDRLREDLVKHVGGPLLDDAAMLLLHRRTRSG
ncbi:PP2C family protein-serine/threonine phosphatase [Thermopolyspora sp. NPDC052614]|uniref:PP2C family protein-serine/threonine phosphatase n=1 Tax=Thermopolyspora sp. NPDC052614 TaxID=3155682 RepID=UPI00341FA995